MLNRLILCSAAAVCALVLSVNARAHDTWVQTNTNIVRVGDVEHIDLMLGNHGNDHRDFKLASKLSAEAVKTFRVVAPDGKSVDLRPNMVDLGYAPKEGFHTARYVTGLAGTHIVSQTRDQLLNFGTPKRVVAGAKAMFVASTSLDRVPLANPGFDRALGHRLELVPVSNPVTPMGPGTPIRVRLLFDGKPIEGVKVSFIPRGVTLKEGLDDRYERLTDAQGRATFEPKVGTYYLIAARLERPDERGEGYQTTHYTATLTVYVPQVCPCCGG